MSVRGEYRAAKRKELVMVNGVRNTGSTAGYEAVNRAAEEAKSANQSINQSINQ